MDGLVNGGMIGGVGIDDSEGGGDGDFDNSLTRSSIVIVFWPWSVI